MNRNRKISTIAYLLVFLICIVLLGGVSFSKLVDFYVNDVVDYNEWTADLGSPFETDVATSFYQKMGFVNVNAAFRNLLLQRQMNGVVKLNNGYLISPIGWVSDESQYNADAVVHLKQYLDEHNISFLYVIAPYTSSKYDPQLPVGVEDFANDNLDRFSAMLQKENVDVLDLREIMHEEGIDQYEMMYRTDHHWTTKGGFYAYTKINEWLMKELNCKVDPQVSNISNYTITTYEKWHLGSNGQRTGASFAGIDDFDLITPNFETSLIVMQEDSDKFGQEGSFEDIFIDRRPLEKRNPFSRYTYDDVYGAALTSCVNMRSDNDKKIVLLTDSYGRAIAPYLSISYKQLVKLGTDVDSLTSSFIEDIYKPDVVIMCLYAGNAIGDGDYARSYYDFSHIY